MKLEARLERARALLTHVRSEQQRQSEFAGLRLGVFARLKELEREERRLLRRIEQMESQVSRVLSPGEEEKDQEEYARVDVKC